MTIWLERRRPSPLSRAEGVRSVKPVAGDGQVEAALVDDAVTVYVAVVTQGNLGPVVALRPRRLDQPRAIDDGLPQPVAEDSASQKTARRGVVHADGGMRSRRPRQPPERGIARPRGGAVDDQPL